MRAANVTQRRIGRIAEHQAAGQVLEVAVVRGLEGGNRLDVLRSPGERAMVDSAMFYLTGTFTRSSRAPRTRRSASCSTRAKWQRPTPKTT
jgi:hypothetical protein